MRGYLGKSDDKRYVQDVKMWRKSRFFFRDMRWILEYVGFMCPCVIGQIRISDGDISWREVLKSDNRYVHDDLFAFTLHMPLLTDLSSLAIWRSCVRVFANGMTMGLLMTNKDNAAEVQFLQNSDTNSTSGFCLQVKMDANKSESEDPTSSKIQPSNVHWSLEIAIKWF